jgi:hypothetical protein
MTITERRISIFILLTAIIIFLSACWLAYQAVGWTGFDRVLAESWGLVTLLDVVLGGVVMSIVIFLSEDKPSRAGLWTVGIFLFGHTLSALWLLHYIFRSQRPLGA